MQKNNRTKANGHDGQRRFRPSFSFVCDFDGKTSKAKAFEQGFATSERLEYGKEVKKDDMFCAKIKIPV